METLYRATLALVATVEAHELKPPAAVADAISHLESLSEGAKRLTLR